MRLPTPPSGRTPYQLFVGGLQQNGLRGVSGIQQDVHLAQNEFEEYGVDWQELENGRVREAFDQRRAPEGRHPFLDQPPPHFSNVNVDPPRWTSPLNELQLLEMMNYIKERVDFESAVMEDRKQVWIHALNFCANVLAADVLEG